MCGPEQQVLSLDLRSMATGGSDSGSSSPFTARWVVVVLRNPVRSCWMRRTGLTCPRMRQPRWGESAARECS